MANNGGLLPTPYWDRFDIVEAHYWHAVDWHGGQWSELYAKLCRIGQYYTPGMLHRGYESLTENGKAIYDQLVLGAEKPDERRRRMQCRNSNSNRRRI